MQRQQKLFNASLKLSNFRAKKMKEQLRCKKKVCARFPRNDLQVKRKKRGKGWKVVLVLFPLLRNLDEDGVAAEEGDDADHDEVLEGDKHVQLEPEAVVEAKDGAQAEVESDAGGWEGHVGDVDADLDPADEHEQDGGDAEEGEGVGDDGRGSNLRLTELVLDLRLDGRLGQRTGLERKLLLSGWSDKG